MIKVNAPSEGIGTGFMQGLQFGASVTPTPQEIQQQQLQAQLLKAQMANIPIQNAIQQQKLALAQQQAQNAQTPEAVRTLLALQQMYGSPTQQPLDNSTQGISSLVPSSAPASAMAFGVSPDNVMPLQSLLGNIFPPSSTSSSSQGLSQLSPQPDQFSQSYNNLNPLAQAYLNKVTGYNPQQQAQREADAQRSLAGARGNLGQAEWIANASDEDLAKLGISNPESARAASVQTIVSGLPTRQQVQYTSGTDFLNQFNSELKPATEKFVNDLASSGLLASGKLQAGKLNTLLGRNDKVWNEYQNLSRLWLTAVSDYRLSLGDNATNTQLAYVGALLKPDLTTMSLPGLLEAYNNLVKHTDNQIENVYQTSGLKGIPEEVLKRPHPDLFDTSLKSESKVKMKSPTGKSLFIPENLVEKYKKQFGLEEL